MSPLQQKTFKAQRLFIFPALAFWSIFQKSMCHLFKTTTVDFSKINHYINYDQQQKRGNRLRNQNLSEVNTIKIKYFKQTANATGSTSSIASSALSTNSSVLIYWRILNFHWNFFKLELKILFFGFITFIKFKLL